MDPQGIELGQGIDELTERACKAVVAIYDYGIEEAALRIPHEKIKSRSVLTRARDSDINVFRHNRPAPALAVLAKFS
jgi:hypothetical protein